MPNECVINVFAVRILMNFAGRDSSATSSCPLAALLPVPPHVDKIFVDFLQAAHCRRPFLGYPGAPLISKGPLSDYPYDFLPRNLSSYLRCVCDSD